MQRVSPTVGTRPARVSWTRSAATTAASPAGVSKSHCRRVLPVVRQTRMVSMMDEPVPWMWIEPLISAGQGSEAEQTSPASRIATPTAR